MDCRLERGAAEHLIVLGDDDLQGDAGFAQQRAVVGRDQAE
jgi:hypothetical protein